MNGPRSRAWSGWRDDMAFKQFRCLSGASLISCSNAVAAEAGRINLFHATTQRLSPAVYKMCGCPLECVCLSSVPLPSVCPARWAALSRCPPGRFRTARSAAAISASFPQCRSCDSVSSKHQLETEHLRLPIRVNILIAVDLPCPSRKHLDFVPCPP
jgi:hypothetical protein